jgi:hypothetical protein
MGVAAIFDRLTRGRALVAISLYTFGTVETLLGVIFLIIVIHGEKNPGLDRLAFKATIRRGSSGGMGRPVCRLL